MWVGRKSFGHSHGYSQDIAEYIRLENMNSLLDKGRHNIQFDRPEYIPVDNSFFVYRKNMTPEIVLGTLIGIVAFVITRTSPVSTLIQSTRQQHQLPSRYALSDDKPDPITRVESSVQGTSNVDFYTLHVYVRNGSSVEEVEFVFSTSDYQTPAALEVAMNATLQAWPHDALQFPEWNLLRISQTTGYFRIHKGLASGDYRFAFGFQTDADELLDLLGFEDIPVTQEASLILATSLVAERPAKLALFKWTPHFDMGLGDSIVIAAKQPTTLKVSANGTYICTVDGKPKYCRKSTFLTGSSFVIRTFHIVRVTLNVVYPRSTPPSGASLSTDEYFFTSPGLLILPESTQCVYIEAVGCGGSSTSGSYGGAGACITGYLQTFPESLQVAVGLTSGAYTRITGTNVDIIAGGGGQGGTFATGGSSRYHGNDGASTTILGTRLGKYSILQNQGKGAKNTSGGASPKGQPGLSLQGGTLAGYPSGGHGHYGGGSGGKEVYDQKTYYGGGGAGSSFTRGLSHVHITDPTQIQTTPKTTKKSISGRYGNGGNVRVPFGSGSVKIFVTYE